MTSREKMREAVKRIDTAYGLELSEEEIDWLVEEAEKMNRLFQKLYEVDVTGIAPIGRLEKKEKG